jgi:hypothetical protein
MLSWFLSALFCLINDKIYINMKFKPANSSENPPVKNTKINLFEAFAGVGSQHMALKNISKAMS